MQYTGIAYENETTVMWCKLIVENDAGNLFACCA